jgi:hypothetical protein
VEQSLTEGAANGSFVPNPVTCPRKRIRRGSFYSLVDLQAAIKRYLPEHNAEPKPFVWKASAASILAKLDRMPVSSK